MSEILVVLKREPTFAELILNIVKDYHNSTSFYDIMFKSELFQTKFEKLTRSILFTEVQYKEYLDSIKSKFKTTVSVIETNLKSSIETLNSQFKVEIDNINQRYNSYNTIFLANFEKKADEYLTKLASQDGYNQVTKVYLEQLNLNNQTMLNNVISTFNTTSQEQFKYITNRISSMNHTIKFLVVSNILSLGCISYLMYKVHS